MAPVQILIVFSTADREDDHADYMMHRSISATKLRFVQALDAGWNAVSEKCPTVVCAVLVSGEHHKLHLQNY